MYIVKCIWKYGGYILTTLIYQNIMLALLNILLIVFLFDLIFDWWKEKEREKKGILNIII